MPTIEQEIKALAEPIWPDYDIDIGPNESGAEWGDTFQTSGYAVHVRDKGGKTVDRVKAGSLTKLREAIEQKLNRD